MQKARQSDQFRALMQEADSALVVAHDYPDPDCLASAYGVQQLLHYWNIRNCVIAFGGFVGRAENRAMMKALGISSMPIWVIDPSTYDRVVMVDCFPGNGNVSLSLKQRVDAVLDHHPRKESRGCPCFCDIRVDVGATSTIVTEYLVEAGCPVPPRLATGLFFGIKTDTGDMTRVVSQTDLFYYKKLFELMDHRLLANIENPERDAEYYRIVHFASGSTLIFGAVGYTHIGSVSTPDYIAEMADFFFALDEVHWMVCTGLFEDHLYFSIRSRRGTHAGPYAERIARGLQGSGGGHGRVAAGRAPLQGLSAPDMLRRFDQCFRQVFRIDEGLRGRSIL